MLSGRILPIHFPPAPDELLSSWYVRLAHANRLKTETFGTVLWGRHRQLWNRDIDRFSPEWLVQNLAVKTGISFDEAWTSTLKSYEGLLFATTRPTGISPWILPVQMYHRKHRWHSLQFCPDCLKDDKEPYFRKRWRLALYTVCSKHGVLLKDRCPECGEPVMFHRLEMGKASGLDVRPLSLCHHCNYDLRLANTETPAPYEQSAADVAKRATEWMDNDGISSTLDVGFYTVLHQICKLLLSKRWGKPLFNFISSKVNVSNGLFELSGDMAGVNRSFIEHHSITDRHLILQFAYWLLADPAKRLNMVQKQKIVLFNRLYRDFSQMPDWYREVLHKTSHTRSTRRIDGY